MGSIWSSTRTSARDRALLASAANVGQSRRRKRPGAYSATRSATMCGVAPFGSRRSEGTAARTRRQVATSRASGPIPRNGQNRSATRGKWLCSTGQVAADSFSPTMPQNAAGIRMEPPKSVPHSNAAIPDATAAAPPPVLPPDVREGS